MREQASTLNEVGHPIEGLGASMDLIRNLIRDDPEALDLLDRATQRPDGRPVHHVETGNNVPSSARPEGNTAAKAIRRLRKDRPDLHAEVIAGEKSANAAAIEAGFRKRTITVPLDPERAARVLLKHFGPEGLQELVRCAFGLGVSPDAVAVEVERRATLRAGPGRPPKGEENHGNAKIPSEGGSTTAHVQARLEREARKGDSRARAMVAAGLVPLFKGEAKENMSAGGKGLANLPTLHARDRAAEAVNVSSRSVGDAQKVQAGAPELADAVKQGTP